MEFNERDNEEPIEGQENQNTETQNNLAEKAYNDIKDTEQGVKDGVNLAKNVSTGNVLGAAKNALNLAKNKKVRKKMIRHTIISILMPVIILIIIATFILGIFNAVGNTIKDILDSIVDAIGSLFIIKDEGIIITDEQLDEIIDKLKKKTNIDILDLKLAGDLAETNSANYEEAVKKANRKYVKKFIEAQAVTEELNREKYAGDSLKGVPPRVFMYRALDTAETTDLNNQKRIYYKPYNEYEKMVQAGDDKIRDYFSIDDKGQLVVPEIVTTIIEENGKEVSRINNIALRYVNYKEMITQYTTSAQFFFILGLIVQNPEFLAALTDIIKNDTEIYLTLMYDKTTVITTETIDYDLQKKNIEIIEEKDKETQQVISREEKITYEIIGSGQDVTITTVITQTPSVKVTYAKTWIIEHTIIYDKTVKGPDETGKAGPRRLPDKVISDVLKQINRTYNMLETTETETWGGGKIVNQKDRTGEKGDGKKSFIGLMEIPFKIPNSIRKVSADGYLISGTEMLFYLLRQNSNTQYLEDIMRYIMYKYTGRNYGVEELDYSIFNPEGFLVDEGYVGDGGGAHDNFPGGGNSGEGGNNGSGNNGGSGNVDSTISNVADYLFQFSHSSEAPQSADGKYYLMYNDGAGWPTIGNADLQWKSHHSKFAVSGMVLKDGTTETNVPNVESYVNGKLGKGPTANYGEENIRDKKIYIEKGLVDKIGNDLIKIELNNLANSLKDLNLPQHQLYALLAIVHQNGHLPEKNGYTFKEVYKEGMAKYGKDTYKHYMFIWDNWWSYISGSYASVMIAREAAFETFVKGKYNVSDAFSRNYYIYYTAEQIARHPAAPNREITRTPENEKDIFSPGGGSSGGGSSGGTSGSGASKYNSSSGKVYTEYKQNKGEWADDPYAGSTISKVGCSLAAVATALSGYGYDFTPGNWSTTGQQSIPGIVKQYATKSQVIYTNTSNTSSYISDIEAHLRKGHPVIVYVNGSGTSKNNKYSSVEHWMTITDIGTDGRVYVSNPYHGSPTGWGNINDVVVAMGEYIKVEK